MPKALHPAIAFLSVALPAILAGDRALVGRAEPPPPRFAQPIGCTLGKDCFILLYPDRDPGSGAIDMGCGRLTYDGHKGTDFAIPDTAAIAKGIAVLAAAKGTVLRVRDGVPDRKATGEEDPLIRDRECGNGIVIDHGEGWETQYCHLRRGSVAVRPGAIVEAGTRLGDVGMSGLATFPHVHFELRYRGQVVDPFLGRNAAPGCKASGSSLWQSDLRYVPTGLVAASFTDRPPTIAEIEQGKVTNARLPATAPAIVFWARSFGVYPGDVETLKVIAPGGAIAVDTRMQLQKASRLWLSFGGRRRRDVDLQRGLWRGEYRLTRNGKDVLTVTRTVQVE